MAVRKQVYKNVGQIIADFGGLNCIDEQAVKDEYVVRKSVQFVQDYLDNHSATSIKIPRPDLRGLRAIIEPRVSPHGLRATYSVQRDSSLWGSTYGMSYGSPYARIELSELLFADLRIGSNSNIVMANISLLNNEGTIRLLVSQLPIFIDALLKIRELEATLAEEARAQLVEARKTVRIMQTTKTAITALINPIAQRENMTFKVYEDLDHVVLDINFTDKQYIAFNIGGPTAVADAIAAVKAAAALRDALQITSRPSVIVPND